MNPTKKDLEFASHYLSVTPPVQNGRHDRKSVVEYASERLAEHEKAAEENAKAGVKPEDVHKKFCEWAAQGDSEKKEQEISAFVSKKIDLAVWPRLLWAGAYFNIESLADGDLPMFITENNDDFQISAFEMGEEGGDRQWQTIEEMSQAFHQMKFYSTGIKYYPLYNIQTGRKDYFSGALQKVTFALAYKMDTVAKAIMEELLCSSGLAAKVASIHPDTEVSTLPSTNDIDLSSGYGTAGVFTKAKWDAILEYVEKWNGDVLPSGNALKLQAVICHPDRKRDSRDFVSLVSGWDSDAHSGTPEANPANVFPDSAIEQIWKSGTLTGMWGHDFAMIGTRTVDVDEVWLKFTEVPGVMYQKPSMDETVRDTDAKMRLKNREGVGLRACKRLVGLSNLSHLVARVTL